MGHPVFYVTFDQPPTEAYPTLGDHDLSKLKSRLPDNALNQVTAFLVSYFLSRFLKMFPCIFLCKTN